MNTIYQLTGFEILAISLGFFILGLLFNTEFMKKISWVWVISFQIVIITYSLYNGYGFYSLIFILSFLNEIKINIKPATLAASDLKVQINQHIEHETRMDEIIDELSLKIANLEDRGIW